MKTVEYIYLESLQTTTQIGLKSVDVSKNPTPTTLHFIILNYNRFSRQSKLSLTTKLDISDLVPTTI